MSLPSSGMYPMSPTSWCAQIVCEVFNSSFKHLMWWLEDSPHAFQNAHGQLHVL